MRSLTYIFLIVLTTAGTLLAQTTTDREAELLSVPKVQLPAEAKEVGLGGKVTARVIVDRSGKVSSVENVSGPDLVCPAVSMPAVVALRKAAGEAALNARFSPAIKKGEAIQATMFVNFQFPGTAFPFGGFLTYVVHGDETPQKDTSPGPKSETSSKEPGTVNGIAKSLPKPSYPAAARAVKAAGAVNVQILIWDDGSVYSAEPIAGHPLLRAAARSAACNSKFSPTLIQGVPVKVSGIITYNFVP
jgi:hypothetical protein